MFECVMSAPSFRACTAALRRLALVIATLVACAGPAAGQEAHEHDAAAPAAPESEVVAAEPTEDYESNIGLIMKDGVIYKNTLSP